MNKERIMAPKVCKLLQPLTQNNVITPDRAKIIVTALIKGDKSPINELIGDRDIPVAFLPIINNIKKEVEELC